MKRYKFLRTGLKSENGNEKWKIGEWKKFRGKLEMCSAGFHCSKKHYQAFSYVQGEILVEAECRGKKLIQDNKECWEEMRITKAYKWEKKNSVALAIYSAELCLKNFEKVYPDDKRPREAIEAAKKWLAKPTKANMSAAWSAAESAESAAWSAKSAAWSAMSAAWSAESAAWSAESAARSARSAAWSARSAAWSAAESAARSAESAAGSARSAAWSARSAAWSAKSAAESAAITKIIKFFDKEVKTLKEIK